MLKFFIIFATVAVCYGRVPAKFYLYTKVAPNVPVAVDSTTTWANTGLNPTINTIILIHGHHGKRDDDFNKQIREHIFEYRAEHNVIVVDWEIEASFAYAAASGSVQLVANDLTAFLRVLAAIAVDAPGPVLMRNVHLVGFGLGAHVAGIASRQLPSALGRVARITGLDPAGSRWGSNSGRLSSSDANYVEVIHTDDLGLLANGIGTPIGQINFYANGGSNQPGCLSHSCSHNRAYLLFAASLRNPRLLGTGCNTMTQMNLNLCRGRTLLIGDTELDKNGLGYSIFRINTARSYPF